MSRVCPRNFWTQHHYPNSKSGSIIKSTSSSDYKGILINPIISKIYEICLQKKFDKYVKSSNNQYGFKKGVGCSHAIYSLHKTIQYYIDRGSNIHLCSIDLVKAFDKVDPYLLFNKLLKKNCPLKFVKILEDWFSKRCTFVKWKNQLSNAVQLHAVVRQGSILSPALFAFYFDNILKKVESSKLSCSFKFICMNGLLYADDFLLIAFSIRDLQILFNLCTKELKVLDMLVNKKILMFKTS